MAGQGFQGQSAWEAALNAIQREMPENIGKALYQEALIETKESMRRTPVLTGALRASHLTKPPVNVDGEITVEISVGGPSAPYALAVHENLDAYHANGQARFLASTVEESAPHMSTRVGARLAKMFPIGGA